MEIYTGMSSYIYWNKCNNIYSSLWKNPCLAGRPIKYILLCLLLLIITGCKTELYSNLSEREANEMLTTLLRNGIASDKVSDRKATFTVRVAETQMADAVEILNEYGFPRESFASMGNLFKKEGLISSPLEERIRFIYALSQSVSETLSQIDGVITARVNVVLPENDPFAEHIKPASASVFIKYRPETNLEDIKSEIKMIVEKSIEGLDYEKVSVVMLPARGSSSQTQRVAWTQIGSLKLAPQSLGTFWTIIGGLGIVLVVAIAGNGLLVWQLKKGGALSKPVDSTIPNTPGIKQT
jgi:type III secretion protein J